MTLKRPSTGQAAALGGTSIATAAIAIAIAQIELGGQPQPHIWSNAWLLLALSLTSIGLIIAAVYFIMAIFDRPGSSSSCESRNDQLLPETSKSIALHVEQMLDGLQLGEHEESERRVNRLFMHLTRNQQQAIIAEIIRVAMMAEDHTCELNACSLLEAADRLDPSLIKVEDVEAFAQSADFSLRSSAAVLMWQWAESAPGRVPIALLGKLAQPSTEDWYVHAAARAGAKELLLKRTSARAIFDRMASSRDWNDRDYAVSDLLEVAKTEPRAVPVDLVKRLTRDRNKVVARHALKLEKAIEGVKEERRREYYRSFGM